jgi:G3E family GTPase
VFSVSVLLTLSTDLITAAELGELRAAVAALNPDAKIVESRYSAVPLAEILHTGRFSMEKAATHSGWMKSIGGEPPSESEEYGISSFVYRAPVPFHPKRLHALMYGDEHHRLQSVIRSKGFVWLATRNSHVAVWGHAGTLYTLERGRAWYATVAPDQWNLLQEDEVKALLARMQSRWGDRGQELVLIGRKMNQAAVRAALDACLLTKEELAAGIDAWRTYEDPFPAWGAGEHDHDHGEDGEDDGDSADEYIL